MRGRPGWGRSGGGVWVRTPATAYGVPNLSITTQPSGAVTGEAFTTQPVIQLKDQYGEDEATADVTVTASLASGTGEFGGTPTAITDASGVATFTNLAITGSGAHTIQFAATGYTSVVSGTVTLTDGSLLIDVTWATAIDSTEAALTDGGKGTWTYDPPVGDYDFHASAWGCQQETALHVVAAGDVGWTGQGNVLEREVHAPGGGHCGHITFFALFPRPAAGQFWVVRYYFASNSTKTHLHAACFWPANVIDAVHWGLHNTTSTLPTYGLSCGWSISELGAGDNAWQPYDGDYIYCTAAAWYRHEFIIEWASASAYRVYPRVYDSSNNLIADHTMMRDGWTGTMMDDYYTAGRYYHLNESHPVDDMRCITFGDGQSVAADGHIWWAHFSAKMGSSNTDFLGPE